MATLDESNATALAFFEAQYTPTLNGVDCNVCGTELKDTHPGYVVILYPPQTPVICDGCGFAGYRIRN